MDTAELEKGAKVLKGHSGPLLRHSASGRVKEPWAPHQDKLRVGTL